MYIKLLLFQVKSLTQADFASRLTINCSASRVHIENMRGVRAITIMDVFDEYALSSPIREEIYELYPYAKLAQLKNGGNFPYLSKFEEVNIHINVSYSCCTKYYIFYECVWKYIN